MNLTEKEKGIVYAVFAYFFWGVAPIYFVVMKVAPAGEILAHRIIWSSVVLFLILLFTRKVKSTFNSFKDWRSIRWLALSSVLLATNWGIFIWAVMNERIAEASLGYYINPLLNIVLGLFFLNEKLRRLQWVAVGFATTGVIIQIIVLGTLPWVALSLAGLFSIYGIIRKQIQVDAAAGLFIEAILLLPFALAYWIFFANSNYANFSNNETIFNLLLIGSGLITTLPLLCFVAGARRLPYSTIGFIQYIGPSLMLILAVNFFGEIVEEIKWITIGLIWIALLLVSVDSLLRIRKA